ncbi:MAG: hypothetical protein LR015_06590 [Verrucomicrobia bacterium]|nr:hypothetical protein [Verrucomicrobiota bacterium]
MRVNTVRLPVYILTLTFMLLNALQGADAVKVTFWNIEWFPGQSLRNVTAEREREHMAVVQNRLAELQPDIFLACEIRDWKAFEELVKVVPGMRVHTVSSFRSRDTGTLWPQQLAIASKLEVRAAWSETWRPTMPGNPRGFAFAALESPCGSGLWLVYSLHLKSNRAANEEQSQINFLQRNERFVNSCSHIEEMESIVFSRRGHGG